MRSFLDKGWGRRVPFMSEARAVRMGGVGTGSGASTPCGTGVTLFGVTVRLRRLAREKKHCRAGRTGSHTRSRPAILFSTAGLFRPPACYHAIRAARLPPGRRIGEQRRGLWEVRGRRRATAAQRHLRGEDRAALHPRQERNRERADAGTLASRSPCCPAAQRTAVSSAPPPNDAQLRPVPHAAPGAGANKVPKRQNGSSAATWLLLVSGIGKAAIPRNQVLDIYNNNGRSATPPLRAGGSGRAARLPRLRQVCRCCAANKASRPASSTLAPAHPARSRGVSALTLPSPRLRGVLRQSRGRAAASAAGTCPVAPAAQRPWAAPWPAPWRGRSPASCSATSYWCPPSSITRRAGIRSRRLCARLRRARPASALMRTCDGARSSVPWRCVAWASGEPACCPPWPPLLLLSIVPNTIAAAGTHPDPSQAAYVPAQTTKPHKKATRCLLPRMPRRMPRHMLHANGWACGWRWGGGSTAYTPTRLRFLAAYMAPSIGACARVLPYPRRESPRG
eukprot:354917-Chlamydomonas_euryale.AAC.24